MPKRRADADSRRFFDEFVRVRVSRFRAMGVIDPKKRHAVIPFPNGTSKLIGVAHTNLKYGGSWSYFICPKCARLSTVITLVDDAPLCSQCCLKLNIAYRTKDGFGRTERLRARDAKLDELIAKLETGKRLRFKPAPKSWRGRAQILYNSRTLKDRLRRRLIELRLRQIANQDNADRAKQGDVITSFQPNEAARQILDLKPIWRAQSLEALEQALDTAQSTIIAALNSNDPQIRANAAKILLNTKQARSLGL